MIREARPEDASAIARVQVASWHAAYRALIPAGRLAAFTVPARTAAWRHNLTSSSGMRTAVFDGPAGVQGFASAGPSRDLRGWGEVWALYVAPTAWGGGVGSGLFADALAALAGRGLTKVLLWMLDGNDRALQFYQGSGFALDGGRKVEDGLAQVRLRRVR